MQTPDLLLTSAACGSVSSVSGLAVVVGMQGVHSSDQPYLRPRDDSGCPACELPPDTASASAASSTNAPTVCVLLLLWLPRGAFSDPGACTPGPALHLLVPRSNPPAPGEIS